MQGLLSNEFEKRKRQIEKGFHKSDDDDLLKGGAGSRGGNVIGYTKSKKPIYKDRHPSHYDESYTAQDHRDMSEVHLKRAKTREAGNKTATGNQAKENEGAAAEYHGLAADHERYADRLDSK